MIAQGILVPWEYSQEYIEIDLNSLAGLSAITSTCEWWPSHQQFVKYNTRSEITRTRGGNAKISLYYESGMNPHLNPEEVAWGRSVIDIPAGALSGKATWTGYDDPGENGTVEWVGINVGLFGEKKRERVSRIQRDQAIFRAALLAHESKCCISGEETLEALEAAHVIPCGRGGAEVIQNGLLLRADLHRLYDARTFQLDPSGRVVNIKGLSSHYQALLEAARIPDQTLNRIEQALRHEWEWQSKVVQADGRPRSVL